MFEDLWEVLVAVCEFVGSCIERTGWWIFDWARRKSSAEPSYLELLEQSLCDDMARIPVLLQADVAWSGMPDQCGLITISVPHPFRIEPDIEDEA